MRPAAWFVALLALAAGVSPALSALTLVENGAPRCAIVVAVSTNANAAYSSKLAGEELAHVLRVMSGASVPIVPEAQLARCALPSNTTLVYVGPTEAARQRGLDAKQFAYEEAVVQTATNAVFVIGDDRVPLPGTHHAATLLCEKFLGARWLWPGDLGEVIPRRATVTLPDAIDVRQTPSVRIRFWRDVANNATFIKQYAEPLGWTTNEWRQMGRESTQWTLRNRMQKRSGIDVRAGHAYERWYERFGESHPEYFAVQPCGQRDLKPRDPTAVKLCHSSPSVIDQVVADIEEAFRKEPEMASFSLSPNDGGFTGHCMCARCKAWDEPDGPPMRLQDAVTREWFEYVSLSDRMVRFYNAVAERVSAHHPNLLLVGHAYCAYDPPPVRAKVHPNVVISYVGSNPYLSEANRRGERARWEGWARTGARMMWRPNWLDQLMGLPVDMTRPFAEDLSFAVRRARLIGTDFDSQYHVWGGMGLSHYVLARLLWDVNLDVDALIQDYCAAGFGRAAPAVHEYFMQIRRVSERHAAGWNRVAPWYDSNGPSFYDETFFREARRGLDRATARAATDPPAVRDRIQFLARTLAWSQISIEILERGRLYRNGDRSQKDRLIELELARQRFCEDHRRSWMLFTPSVIREARRFAKWAFPVPEKELMKAK
ncbi:MAG: DUF4838 domain-containing protein [Verrucomicrobiae bacterium]|nr:DUF4838 domain-containing protein [Verrucomicrobiae bacterium]